MPPTVLAEKKPVRMEGTDFPKGFNSSCTAMALSSAVRGHPASAPVMAANLALEAFISPTGNSSLQCVLRNSALEMPLRLPVSESLQDSVLSPIAVITPVLTT
jgi:hypothetical protein